MGPLRPQAPQSRASPLTIPSLTAQSAVKKYPFAAKIRISDFPKRAVGFWEPHGGISEIVCLPTHRAQAHSSVFVALPIGLPTEW